MKNGGFIARMGYALAGIRIAWRREKSFRTQCVLGLVAAAVTIALRPGWIWAAAVALSMGLVLALELANAALEYLTDRVHPDIHPEIKFAKDAAAGAVLLASFTSLVVGALIVASCFI